MIQLAGFGAGPFSKPMHARILRSSNCLLDGYFSCKQLLNPGNANTINPRPIQHGVQNVLSLFSNYWNYWTSKSKSLKKSAFPYISPHQTSPDSFGEHAVPRLSSHGGVTVPEISHWVSTSKWSQRAGGIGWGTHWDTQISWDFIRFLSICSSQKWGAMTAMKWVSWSPHDKWLFWVFFWTGGEGQYQLLGAMGQTE